MDTKEIIEAQIKETLRGHALDTPLKVMIRVFHESNPDYTYKFVRQEEDDVVVLDDDNGLYGEGGELKVFPVKEMVNVALYQEAVLAAGESPRPVFSEDGHRIS